jgi:hypothetical protein
LGYITLHLAEVVPFTLDDDDDDNDDDDDDNDDEGLPLTAMRLPVVLLPVLTLSLRFIRGPSPHLVVRLP